jgi:hypothetical protein
MTTPLSPAAQAVLDAALDAAEVFVQAGTTRQCIAAAFRAAADREKLGPDHWEGSRPDDYERGWNAALRRITALATELDPTP